ncbi:unnamed protein product [Schistosoma intercalatum]|nr:unnamed protein product [Schistosoma intercalatum]
MTYASMCTGSLVSTRAVLTAGHCVCGETPIVRISFLSLREFEQRTINHQPSEIKVAPDYYPVCQLKRENKRITKSLSGYDMAIITLTSSVNLETGIKVVSLATESDIPIPESIVYMVGYGQDVKDSDPAGRNGGILKKGKTMCTGSLVSTRAVLTAGHCVCSPLPVSRVSFLTLRIGDPKGIHYKPSGVKVAPDYMPSCTSKRQGEPAQYAISGADIAVIMLAQLVNVRTGIKVLSLPQPTDIPTPGTPVFIVGYGRDDNDRDPQRKNGGILKKGSRKMSSDQLKQSFLSFCNFVKKDCQIYSKNLDTNRIDIEFRAHIGSTKRDVDFPGFVSFLEGRLAKVYAAANGMEHEDAVIELKRKIAETSPAIHGGTKISSDPTTSRLTNVKTFTGSHKERFDIETGKGLGKAGRVDPSPCFTTSGISEPRK